MTAIPRRTLLTLSVLIPACGLDTFGLTFEPPMITTVTTNPGQTATDTEILTTVDATTSDAATWMFTTLTSSDPAPTDATSDFDSSSGAPPCTVPFELPGLSVPSGMSQPWSMIAADMNGDGTSDLAIADYSNGGARVLINEGAGTLTAGTPLAGRAELCAADLDADGDLDLALASAFGGVSVHQNDGAGTFAAGVQYSAAPSHVSAIVAADFTGDDKLDLVAANSQMTVLMRNQGDGTFALPVALELPFLRDLVAADLDGDGLADLATAGFYMLNLGDGNFDAPVVLEVGDTPLAIAAADLNGDDKPDLAIATAHGEVSVLQNLGGSFGPGMPFPAGPGIDLVSIVAADLSGDEKIDLAVADSYEGVTVLLNTGNGGFYSMTHHDLDAYYYWLVAADLDDDGATDLAAANVDTGLVTILFNCPP